MKNGSNLQILINKLEERGVLNKGRAEAARRMAILLDNPTSKAIRHLLVKTIIHLVSNSINGR